MPELAAAADQSQPNSPAQQQPPTAYRHAGGGEPAPQSAEGWVSKTFTRDDLKGHASLARFKSADDMGRAYVELERRVGAKVGLPGPDATPEQRDEFFKSIGRPETPDKYSVGGKLQELVFSPADERVAKSALRAFHKAGMSDAQATAVVSFFAEQQRAQMDAEQQVAENGIALLRHQWDGAGGNGFAREWNTACDGLDRLSKNVPGLKALMKDPRFGSHPVLIRLFHLIGTMLADGAPATTPRPAAVTPADELRARKSELMKRDGPYWNGRDPGHKQAVEEVARLNAQMAQR